MVAVALVVAAAGFGQFGVVAALADVADAFGEARTGDDLSVAEQAGLSGTALGVGLAVVRLASLASLPLAAAADRVGRRRALLGTCGVGLALVAAAALSPTYWWFVAVLAVSRPLLTATNTVGAVAAAEHTSSGDRAAALALVAAAYGVGAGLIAVIRGAAAGAIGFQGVFGLALVPLVGVALAGRYVTEPDRFSVAASVPAEARPVPVLGALGPGRRGRVALLAAVGFAVASVTGPANSFVFLYAEHVLDLSPAVTAAMVVSAGGAGLAGLLLGRWAADTIGRRVTAGGALVAMAGAGILTYSGSVVALVVGYQLAVLAGSVFGPPAVALQAELFPTAVRAAVAGWVVSAGVLGAVTGLVVFGAVADAGDRFGLAAWVVFVPATLAVALLPHVPETRGRELEDVAD